MDASVILSVKPEWGEKILLGEKVVELRRRFPIFSTPVNALLYASSPIKALVGVVTIRNVVCLPPSNLWQSFANESCVSFEQFQ